MTQTMPTWTKWALFAAGAVALAAIPFWLKLARPFSGPAMVVAILAWVAVYTAYMFVGTARLKGGKIGPVMKRYRRRLVVSMLAYTAALLGSLSLIRGAHLDGPLLWIVAAAPAVPILGVLLAMGLYLKEEPDEFERRIHVEAMLWGLGAVLAVTTVWGFLSNANVVPAPPLYLVFPMFCLAWGFSQPFIRRRYQ